MSSHVKNLSYNLNVARQNKCCGTVLCNLVSQFRVPLKQNAKREISLFLTFFNLTCQINPIKYLVCMALLAFDVVKETCAFHLVFRRFED